MKKKSEEVITRGKVGRAQSPSGKDNAISDVERVNGAFVPFIFPWFQYL